MQYRPVVGGAISGVNAKFKVVLLGETGVGKSSLVHRLIEDDFCSTSKSTQGACYLYHTIQLEDCQINLAVWDTAGQEQFRSLAKMYFRGANAAVVVYDVTNYNSFERAQEWVKEICTQCENPDLVVVLAGNKMDLVEEEPSRRRVQLDEARTYASNNDLHIIETSAKDSTNVTELFTHIARQLAYSMLSRGAPPPVAPPLPQKKPQQNKSCC
eukprot:TRINITY_DN765_c4_g1_i1.p1 TRINITY_DN765_c4_g1~~TRINITY_DN765_c4_g1_i1.p1  ORF type:complete len:213 (+),score=34.67 TRINITY_DN765_c4_g1_i1:44-682(+)